MHTSSLRRGESEGKDTIREHNRSLTRTILPLFSVLEAFEIGDTIIIPPK